MLNFYLYNKYFDDDKTLGLFHRERERERERERIKSSVCIYLENREGDYFCGFRFLNLPPYQLFFLFPQKNNIIIIHSFSFTY
ncbi:hypothetical protein L6452_33331 [Arctium lappa]|uniref:Uncharacterized protein n=1 Tax=Arctium lappa TaxID=4217 RepID=A0ACB8YEG7_ARCLA|nr:hypothetical protein L6452_33331 [Arctium lappa]